MDARTFSGALSCVCVCTYSFHYSVRRMYARPQSINFNIKMEYSRNNFYLAWRKHTPTPLFSLRAPQPECMLT